MSTQMTFINRADITGLILAGGQSRRFNFRDKGLIDFKQKPMIAHVIERIAPHVNSLAISCNTNLNQYQVLCDTYRASLGKTSKWGVCLAVSANHTLKGPLAGIDRHLKETNTPYCFVCSCDMPLIPSGIISSLADAMTDSRQQACHIVDAEGRHQLAILVQTTTAIAALDELTKVNSVKTGNLSGRTDHSIKHWLKQMNSLGVAHTGLSEQLTSINTPEQLSAMEMPD
jgi:molybdopterin-guanine dinucleotide biosynthesis protein A